MPTITRWFNKLQHTPTLDYGSHFQKKGKLIMSVHKQHGIEKANQRKRYVTQLYLHLCEQFKHALHFHSF